MALRAACATWLSWGKPAGEVFERAVEFSAHSLVVDGAQSGFHLNRDVVLTKAFQMVIEALANQTLEPVAVNRPRSCLATCDDAETRMCPAIRRGAENEMLAADPPTAAQYRLEFSSLAQDPLRPPDAA